MLDQATYLDQVLGTPGLTADATRLNWIGRILSNSAVLYAWHLAKVKRIEDAQSEVIDAVARIETLPSVRPLLGALVGGR